MATPFANAIVSDEARLWKKCKAILKKKGKDAALEFLKEARGRAEFERLMQLAVRRVKLA